MLKPESWTYRLLAVAVFPVGVFVLPASGYALYLQYGNLFWATLIPTIVLIGFIGLCEYGLPFRDDWQALRNKNSQKNTQLNLLYWASSFVCQEFIVKATLFAVLVPVISQLAAVFGHGVFWPHHWPVIIQVIMLFILSDFLVYWGHRIMHEWHHGWALHQLHHSLTELNWSASARLHPLEHFFNSGPRYLVMILVSAQPEVILVYLLYNNCLGLLVHSNIKANTRFFDYFLYTPNYHRFHHSQSIQQSNNNYSGPTLLWDWLFGTLYLPHRNGPDQIGLSDAENQAMINRNKKHLLAVYWQQWLAPFRYWRNKMD